MFLMRMTGHCRLLEGVRNTALEKHGKANYSPLCLLQGSCQLREMSLEIGDTRPMNISIVVNVRILYIDLPAIEASPIIDYI
jgi:hypothetical protein